MMPAATVSRRAMPAVFYSTVVPGGGVERMLEPVPVPPEITESYQDADKAPDEYEYAEFLDMFSDNYSSDSITFEDDRRTGKSRRCLSTKDGKKVHHVFLEVNCEKPSLCEAILAQTGCDKSAFMRISRKRNHVFYAKLDKMEVAALKEHRHVWKVCNAADMIM